MTGFSKHIPDNDGASERWTRYVGPKARYGVKLFALIPLLILAMGCTSHFPSQHEGDPSVLISLTDFRGKELQLKEPVGRVVCLIESAFSGICMLRAQDQVAAVPGDVYKDHLYVYYSVLDERIRERSLPSPGNWEFISIEQVVALKPDLVIAWASQTEAIAAIETFGIPVYGVMLHGFEDVYKEMMDFGLIFGRQERADSLVRFTRANLERTLNCNRNGEKARVYFMWAQGINETSGINSTVNELLHYAGTINACDLDDEHVTVSVERIMDWAPDIIVMWYNEKLDPGDIASHPLLQGLEAVMKGQVYELPDVFSCDFWTLKLQYPVALVADWAYPGQAHEFDREKEREDMFRFLYGKKLPSIE